MTDAETTSGKKKKERQSLRASMRTNFLYGLAVGIPIIATVGLIWFIVSKFDEFIKPKIPPELNPDTYLPFDIPGVGLLVTIIGIYLLGVLARNFFGRRILALGERLVNRVPLIRTVYNFVKQVVETITQNNEQSFREVVLVEYPRKDAWVMGFVTSDVKGFPKNALGEGWLNIFVPTTPNPTSGFLLMVHRSEVKVLDNMTVEEGAKLIISAGVVSDPSKQDPVVEERPRILRRMEKAAKKAQKAQTPKT